MTLATAASSRTHSALRVGILTLVAGVLTWQAAAQDAASLWQSPESIRTAAREFALQAVGGTSTATIEAVGVDDRLKLAACSQPLDTQLQRAIQRGQGTIAVSCSGTEPWRLFVPVRVSEPIAVLVVRRNVQPGEALTADDLQTRVQASSSLPYDYLSDVEQAVGLTVKRTIPAGTILVPAFLERPELIERGALVTLISGSGPVIVKSEGVALGPARLKGRVRVRSQSGRVVEGVVEASGQVRVGS